MRNKIASYISPQASENGSVCLAMLSAYYGKRIPLIRAAQLCGVTQDGCSMEQISGGAGSLGFETELCTVDPETLRRRGQPCIITLNGNYAVFARCTGGRVLLYTPDRGRVRMPLRDFAAACGEHGLYLKPPQGGFPEDTKRSSSLTYAITLILGKKASFAVLYVTLISAVSVLLLFLPQIISEVTDAFYSDTGTLTAQQADGYMLKVILCLLTLLVLEIFIINAFSRFSVDVSNRCRRRFLWASMNLPLGHYQTRSDGYFMESAGQSLNLGFFLSKQVVDVVLRPVLAVILLFSMARVSPLCTLVVLVSVAVMLAASLISARFENERGKIVFSDAAKVNGFLLEGLKAIRSIRNAGAEFVFFRSFVKINRNAARTATSYMAAQRIFGILPASVSNLTKLALILVGIVSVYSGSLSFGSLFFLHGVFCIVQQYLQTAVFSGKELLSIGYQLENQEEIYREALRARREERAEEEKAGEEAEFEKLKGDIRLRNVCFGYNQYFGEVLHDISMDIPAGSSIAIVGASGCGKTTLKHLICGRHRPWSGQILYDGTESDQVPKQVLAGSIASVDQQIIMFGDTIMNNIKMWDTTQLDADSILAARDAEIHRQIIQREGGYKAMFAEDGANFSGGERQRIEIARALSMDPSILVMDEATSALDTIVEKRIVQHVQDRGITVIVVAHRLSTIRNCDCIYVMDGGRFVAHGTHEELMESCPLYHELVTVE